jgi:hypothetical protein
VSTWPPGMAVRPLTRVGLRTRGYVRSPFSAGWSSTVRLLQSELAAVKARNVVLEVDIDPAQFRSPVVVLSFDGPKVGAVSFPADRFATWQDNLRAIALGMEALRKVDRYGITRSSEQYQGWKQLPVGNGSAASAMTRLDAERVLLDTAGRGSQFATMQDWHRAARRAAHPDRHDGDRSAWDLVEQAGHVLGVAP